ncbi:hypothetical protein NOGI109294_09320 [Nocardiopsis gilva]
MCEPRYRDRRDVPHPAKVGDQAAELVHAAGGHGRADADQPGILDAFGQLHRSGDFRQVVGGGELRPLLCGHPEHREALLRVAGKNRVTQSGMEVVHFLGLGRVTSRTVVQFAHQQRGDLPGERRRVGVVEHDHLRQGHSRRGAQAVAQLHHGERIEARFEEIPLRVDVLGAAVPENRCHVGAHQFQDLGLDPLPRLPGEAVAQRVHVGLTADDPPFGAAHQALEERWQVAASCQ